MTKQPEKGMELKTCPFRATRTDYAMAACRPDCVLFDPKAYCVVRRAMVALAVSAEAQP